MRNFLEISENTPQVNRFYLNKENKSVFALVLILAMHMTQPYSHLFQADSETPQWSGEHLQ